MLASMVAASGQQVFCVTTLGFFHNQVPTPPSTTWDGFLGAAQRAHTQGCRRGVVELTSMALSRGHAQRFRFDIGVFTNLSRDHLNLHGSPEAYLAAKAQLFVFLGPGATAVLNARDPAAAALEQAIPGDVERLWYGVPARGAAHHSEALSAVSVDVTPEGTSVKLAPSRLARSFEGELWVPMVGRVYAENALAAAGAGLAMGLAPEAIVDGLAKVPPVKGRFEIVAHQPIVAIDYAHSADALELACHCARQLAREQGGEVWVVFGAGGNTDETKREPMGQAVGQGADHVVVTSDNPRNEDPAAITKILAAACRAAGCPDVTTQLERRQAIAHALGAAQPQDVVLIAGKGHETGQVVSGQTHAFSDHEEVGAWLQRHT